MGQDIFVYWSSDRNWTLDLVHMRWVFYLGAIPPAPAARNIGHIWGEGWEQNLAYGCYLGIWKDQKRKRKRRRGRRRGKENVHKGCMAQPCLLGMGRSKWQKTCRECSTWYRMWITPWWGWNRCTIWKCSGTWNQEHNTRKGFIITRNAGRWLVGSRSPQEPWPQNTLGGRDGCLVLGVWDIRHHHMGLWRQWDARNTSATQL